MNRRTVPSMLAVGLFDDPPKQSPGFTPMRDGLEWRSGRKLLLKNDGPLPLGPALRRIAVIGGYADVGVLSGGGSSQVPPGGAYLPRADGRRRLAVHVLHPSPPLAAIQALGPPVAVASTTADTAAAGPVGEERRRRGPVRHPMGDGRNGHLHEPPCRTAKTDWSRR